MDQPAGHAAARIDKWLWAARFFRSRTLAIAAVNGGKVHVNGQRVKPSRSVRPGDLLEITRGREVMTILVTGLSERRGPAPAARLLYRETDDSLQRREQAANERRLHGGAAPAPPKRPDKRARRLIRRFREG